MRNSQNLLRNLRATVPTEMLWSPPLQPAQCEPKAERSAGSQLALLKLRRSRYADDCIDLLHRGTARATPSDTADLIADRLARKHDLGWLVLTASGRAEADRIAWSIAQGFGLHHFRDTGGRLANTVICSCGQWSASVPHFSRHTSGSRDRAISNHLRKVQEARDG